MKIAVASEGKMVTEHFEHCKNFMLKTIRAQRHNPLLTLDINLDFYQTF